MKRILLAITMITSALALLVAGCTPAAKAGPGAVSSEPTTAVAGERHHHTAPADPRTHYSPAAGRTFLDTLNQGKEVALAPEDLPALEVATVSLIAAPSGSAAEAATSEPRFRIQILASSQIDMVRKAKLEAESVLELPVFMVAEQALYKLYVGEFKTRQEADTALPEVRKKGYGDAWIVGPR